MPNPSGKVKEKRKKGKCKHIYLIIDHFQVGHHNDFHHIGTFYCQRCLMIVVKDYYNKKLGSYL